MSFLAPTGVRGRAAALLAVCLFAAIVGVWAYRVHSVKAPPGLLDDRSLWGMEDFRDAVYYPVRALLDGVNPYYTTRYQQAYPVVEVFPLYSPAFLVVHLPFGFLDVGPAHVAFFAWSVLLLLALSWLLLRVVGLPTGVAGVFGLGALLAAGRPLYSMLSLGQWTLIVVIGIVLALHYAKSRPVVGGGGLALALLKPTFGVPLVLLMLARGERRSVGIGLLIAVVSAAIPLAVLLAVGGPAEFIAGIGDNVSSYWAKPANRLDTASWSRIDAGVAVTRLLPVPAASWLSPLLALLVIGGAAFKLRAMRATDATSLSSLIVCVALTVGIYHQSYDATLLALPLLALAAAARPPLSGHRRGVALLLLAAVWFNYAATQMGLDLLRLEPYSPAWRFVTSFNALALLGVLGLAITTPRSDARTAPQEPAMV